MQFQTASFFLLASVFSSYTAAFTEQALDCCLSTSNVPIPHRIVVSFSIQTTEGGCPIPATVFITKKGKALCAPLPTGNWVTKVICKISRKEPGCRHTKKTKPQRKKRRGARQ
ncbi:hypothetical protein SKAU_G00014260 [Synaphobranchus kaupii]|uniref:Chemokine interleukin-8-like domain-containing protein n=1 Tax=Synaphobranchus kaupii TaxID=118154 RepID=A0A9Q1GBK9_SYNKA|nr:hypothetical protein SKAU_G00014260 [Synaphobranchus kaupii]